MCRLSLVAETGGDSLVAVHRVLTAVAPLVVEYRPWVHGFSCPAACGIFQDQRSNQRSCIARQMLSPWTTREAPKITFKSDFLGTYSDVVVFCVFLLLNSSLSIWAFYFLNFLFPSYWLVGRLVALAFHCMGFL